MESLRQKIVKPLQWLHHHLAYRPHLFFSKQSKYYDRWHQWRWHPHIHAAVLGSYMLAIGLSIIVSQSALATSSWTQSDWGGGQGASALNQYQSIDNVTINDSGQPELELRNKTAVLRGDTLAGGSSNYNVATATAVELNDSQDYHQDTYTYTSGQPTRLVVDQAGDYLVSVTMPITSSYTNGSYRDAVRTEVYVNGTKYPGATGRSSYIRNYTNNNEASNHIGLLLEDLNADDYIEVFVKKDTSDVANTLAGITTLYVEQISDDSTVFNARATNTTSGTNLNSSQAPLNWQSTRKDSGFSHDNSTNQHQITVDQAGTYFATVNIPLASSVQRPNIIGKVLVDGAEVDSAEFAQGYIRNYDNHANSSIHWSGLITTTAANQVVTISVQQEAASGTVTVGGETASLFIEKLAGDKLFQATATQAGGSNDWNPAAPAGINWSSQKIIDPAVFDHSTSANNHQITVLEDGDYLLSFNANISGASSRANPKVQVRINDTPLTGAEAKSAYRRQTSGHDQSSDQLLYPLVDLAAGDVVSLHVEREGNAGVANDTDPTQVSLIKKGYQSTGTLTSSIFDPGYDADWGTVQFSNSGGGTISLKARSDTNSDMSTATNWASCGELASGDSLTDSPCISNGDRYMQYKVTFTLDSETPILDSVELSYTPSDITAPTTNASNVTMYTSNGGSAINSNSWTNNSKPYFDWDNGADNSGGSGLKGYCLYLGLDDTANPISSKGLLGTSPVETNGQCQFIVEESELDLNNPGLIGNALATDNAAYYLNVKAVDVVGNVFNGAPAQFQFRFDNTDPINPSFITAPSNFISSKNVNLSWPTGNAQSASDANTGLAGLQYRIGISGTWYGDAHTGAQDGTDLLANDGSYTTVDPIDYDALNEGNNIIYFRSWDLAGNVSDAYVTTVIKLNTQSPSPPQNVSPSPITNTTNQFSFSWLPPTTFTGQEANLRYCYVINALPTASNCTFTDAGVTELASGAYATQPGQNTLYVVAKDEAGNINYASYGFVTFTANTSAPGIAQNIDIADISVKSTANWKLAITWEEPLQIGAGIANYRIYRSNDDGASFSQAATTSGTSYVDTGLDQLKYRYYVKACDSANNCGAVSGTVKELPSGKFTAPAQVIVEPSASDVSTRSATISWITKRNSDSKVALGLKSGLYGEAEIANSDQSTVHEIKLTNLDPGKTYFYKARWTDEDGNTGSSTEKTFTTLPAPTVKKVSIEKVNLSVATVNFTSTDAIQAKIYFGKSENFGGLKVVNTSVSESDYTAQLTGLDDGSEYFMKINPIDRDGNEYEGTVLSFETPPRPIISNVSFQPVEGEPTSTQKVSWTTNVPATSLIRYGRVDGGSTEIIDSKLKKQHELIIKNLTDNSEYTLTAQSRDKDANLAVSDNHLFRTALDTRPPKISDLTVEATVRGSGAEARGQIVVSWKTDEPATSQVAYGEGSGGDYTSRSAEDTVLKQEHLVIVSDVPTSRVYHLQPVSKDGQDNTAEGEDQSAIIGRASESVLSIIVTSLQRIFGL